MIYGDESQRPCDADLGQMMAEFGAVTREMNEKGAFLGGGALQPTASATTVRMRNGERLVTDGPFAETREQLGGYYLLECKDLDEALAWAARIPNGDSGSVEVRPIAEIPA